MADTIDRARPDTGDRLAGPDGSERPGAERSGAHVLVVDDDARMRQLLKRYLIRSGYGVTEARDAAHARKLLAALAFDILIVDVMMPGEDGLSLTRAFKSHVPILMLTARGETESRIEGLEAGADDYLAKPFEPRELLLRIDAILRRSYAAPPKTKNLVVHLGGASFDVDRGELRRDDAEIRLTTAEIALMRMLARRVNQPVSRTELLAELGPEDSEERAQERAVDVQITRLRKKIETTPKEPRFIKTVRGAGYMLTPDSEAG